VLNDKTITVRTILDPIIAAKNTEKIKKLKIYLRGIP
jgi:hypothetical protein